MKIGMIGLGRMGANMAQRLRRGGHPVVGFDPRIEARKALEGQGAQTAESLAALVAKLQPPRVLWLMVPAGEVTDATLDGLLPLLQAGDTLVDGGNSHYQDSLRRAATFAGHGIGYVDCGTSGGVWGLAEGHSLMIGGDEAVVERLYPLFECLAPVPDRGWGCVGPAGAGHFAKMVHNGIEYGLMQAYAEGFSILRHKCEFDLDLQQLADIWSHGSVVRSWLLELTAKALAEHPGLHDIAPYVADSGEGRWTVDEAIALGVPAPVITHALIARLRSRDPESFADRLLAVLRNQFGGHELRKE
ncbi:phosphogluconate dehydrogenase (NAD(+)-dependent, decarboxylating) [Pseudomonas sp. PDM20]|uniref:phosphogluconate dehydrogenase (NAD(+)-dependent, decarboxylating) n=1 Tax=Pseudomonas sp. PDM20 TaxID=2769254 RepID=UPI001780BE05|nr:decarboxylating 6-phosphogluconate dehydrogenase [Pseudomonas sp. PDM20]MBD9683511.1 decarboxylating 6-phosphogluconate dehydrogenase [Pseudomonas sp. PDM20]